MTEQEPTKIIEQLPDGRIRYLCGGQTHTGWQHGLYAVREEPVSELEALGSACGICHRRTGPLPFSVDLLFSDPPYEAVALVPTKQAAVVLADSLSLSGDGHHAGLRRWFCSQMHQPHEWIPFRHWLREQRDAG